MGYDIEFIVLKSLTGLAFPVDGKAAGKVLAEAQPLNAAAVRDVLLAIPGSKPGPDDAVDYLGNGLSYARMTVRPKAIHVDNNCGAKDVIKILGALTAGLGAVLIRDLQSGDLHDAQSYANWWAKPL